MIKNVVIINYLGESISMALHRPEESGFIIANIDGLGPVKADINMSKMATTDGSKFNSSRLNTRNIVLTLEFLPHPTIEDSRRMTYRFFPIKRPIELIIETDGFTASTEGYVESNEPDIFSERESTKISIVCPNPYFKEVSPYGNSEKFLYTIEPKFEFLFPSTDCYQDSNGWDYNEFGDIRTTNETVITYDGDASVPVVIRAHIIEPVKDFMIYNPITREQIKFSSEILQKLIGEGLKALDDVFISTSRDNTFVTLIRDGKAFNVINCINRDANWFYINKGDNIIAYTSTSGSDKIKVSIRHDVIFEGI